MTKLRTRLAAAAATAGLGVGLLLSAAPKAEAATVCMPSKPQVRCSMFWANRAYPAHPHKASIVNLQRALIQIGYNVGPTNGVMNARTVSQLKAYERSRGIPQTGKLNARTIGWLRVGAGPVVKPAAPKPATTSATSKAVTFATKQIGKPYRYGATGPSSYDCSGLTGAAWKAGGKSLPRTSYAQLSKYRSVSKSALQPGDIVGYYGGGHVGIYVGNGYIIHSSKPGKPVAKVSVNSMPFYKAVRP